MTDITERLRDIPRANLYAERDPLELGDYYLRHVDRMTREGLHDKSDIAAELGWRDMEIDRLRARLEWDARHPDIDGIACRDETIKLLDERVAELERDAARYRWLRHGDNDDEVIRGDTRGVAFLPRNAELDAVIDAAMTASHNTALSGSRPK